MRRILQVLSGNKNFSGIASYLYQQYKYMDREKVRYDFFFCKENSMELAMNDPIFKDSEFYVINGRIKKTGSTDYLKVVRELNRILAKTHYDVVVVNTSIITIIYACLVVVKKYEDVKLIAHAHNLGLVLNKGTIRYRIMPIMCFLDNVLRGKIRKNAYALFGCSNEAGMSTFGKTAVDLNKFKVIRNAIDLQRFHYNEDVANSVRKEMNVCDDTFVIGNVGCLCKRKNQEFLIEVFNLINRKWHNSKLWIIGDGPDKERLVHLVRKYELVNDVEFLGQREDVFRYMQGMDMFVFPSLSEGLGIAAIESQAAGLPTVVSDGVPEDVLLTPLVKRIGLGESLEKWGEEISSMYKKYPKHVDFTELLIENGYDISAEAKKIEEYYLNIK